MYLTNGENTHESNNPTIIDAFLKSGYRALEAPPESTEAEEAADTPSEPTRRGKTPKVTDET